MQSLYSQEGPVGFAKDDFEATIFYQVLCDFCAQGIEFLCAGHHHTTVRPLTQIVRNRFQDIIPPQFHACSHREGHMWPPPESGARYLSRCQSLSWRQEPLQTSVTYTVSQYNKRNQDTNTNDLNSHSRCVCIAVLMKDGVNGQNVARGPLRPSRQICVHEGRAQSPNDGCSSRIQKTHVAASLFSVSLRPSCKEATYNIPATCNARSTPADSSNRLPHL